MQKYDYIKLPVNDRFGVVMRKDCPLAKLHSIRPEDIGDYPVWVAHQQIEGNVLSSWLGRDLQSLNIVSTFNLITTPAMMIEEGFGMAFTFDHLVSTGENSSLCFRPLEHIFPDESLVELSVELIHFRIRDDQALILFLCVVIPHGLTVSMVGDVVGFFPSCR